ncbi:hypothetical protein CBL_11746 [Carabus blaptoides fortunei]
MVEATLNTDTSWFTTLAVCSGTTGKVRDDALYSRGAEGKRYKHSRRKARVKYGKDPVALFITFYANKNTQAQYQYPGAQPDATRRASIALCSCSKVNLILNPFAVLTYPNIRTLRRSTLGGRHGILFNETHHWAGWLAGFLLVSVCVCSFCLPGLYVEYGPGIYLSTGVRQSLLRRVVHSERAASMKRVTLY